MEERIAQRRMYDESLSYAMNVTRQFWTPRFRDTPVPKGVFVTNSTLGRDITLTTLSWATGPSSFLPGGFGLALGMDILGELGKETPPDMLPHILAYVDTDRFPSRRDAELEAVTQVFNAVKKGLADTGFKIAKETQPMRQKVLWTEISTAAADIENEAQGCALWSQFAGNTKGWRNKAYGVGISIEQIDEDDLPAVKVPEWIRLGRLSKVPESTGTFRNMRRLTSTRSSRPPPSISPTIIGSTWNRERKRGRRSAPLPIS